MTINMRIHLSGIMVVIVFLIFFIFLTSSQTIMWNFTASGQICLYPISGRCVVNYGSLDGKLYATIDEMKLIQGR